MSDNVAAQRTEPGPYWLVELTDLEEYASRKRTVLDAEYVPGWEFSVDKVNAAIARLTKERKLTSQHKIDIQYVTVTRGYL